ncbi:hypothetical protein TW95_gp1447 [Pandoravirus inopinatum]|uniref:Uncharacterized protein n=1 Tax=Pandoravirus inopinatum TaxID=1605721 RepID=A0A0B5JB30_9VIRU|nr:hypothetical protein TW95_gp1447 [Pandoravirus inopinatum]AJF98181.1 hypothetical protein [Pandoravirus inopinatum]
MSLLLLPLLSLSACIGSKNSQRVGLIIDQHGAALKGAIANEACAVGGTVHPCGQVDLCVLDTESHAVAIVITIVVAVVFVVVVVVIVIDIIGAIVAIDMVVAPVFAGDTAHPVRRVGPTKLYLVRRRRVHVGVARQA